MDLYIIILFRFALARSFIQNVYPPTPTAATTYSDFYTHKYTPSCDSYTFNVTNSYSSASLGLQRLECLATCTREPMCKRAVYGDHDKSCLLEDDAESCPHGQMMWLEKKEHFIEVIFNNFKKSIEIITIVQFYYLLLFYFY